MKYIYNNIATMKMIKNKILLLSTMVCLIVALSGVVDALLVSDQSPELNLFMIPVSIKSNILIPFYKTAKCTLVLKNFDVDNETKVIKEAMDLTSVMVDEVYERKDCINVLIIIKDLENMLNNDYTFKKENIVILSYDEDSSNRNFTEEYHPEFGASNVLFVSVKKLDFYILNSPFSKRRTFKRTELWLIEPWMETKKKKLDLEGEDVNVVTFHCPLYTILDGSENPNSADGIEMLIARELSRQLNFTISLKIINDENKWGYRLSNGSWVKGIMSVLSNGEAEFGFCSLWAGYHQSLVVDFTPSWSKLYLTYLVPRPRKLGDHWKSILSPFQPSLWISVVAAVVLVSLLEWIISNVRIRGVLTAIHGETSSLQTSIVGVIGVLSLASSMATRNNNRHLVSTWYLFALLITTAFSSSIVSRLTYPSYEKPLDTVQQLVNGNFFWGKYYDTSNISNILNFENPWHKSFSKRFRTVTTEEISKLVKSNRFAVLAQSLESHYIFTEFSGITDDDLGRLRVMKEFTNEYFISISFRKHSPLYAASSRIIQALLEAGLVHYWIQDVIRKHGRPAMLNVMMDQGRDSSNGPVKLTLSNLQGAFYLWLFGILLGALCFGVERLTVVKP